MTNTQIKLFVKIAETGSFTKAGLELNMTQPAVSRAISSLESELDIPLLLRDRRSGVRLTEAGQRILVLFREILGTFAKVDQAVADEKGLQVGTIRVGAFPVAGAHFLPPIIAAIAEKHPGIEFELHEGNIDELRSWLETRVIDIAFLIPPDDDWETIPLYREKMYAVIREDNPLSRLSVIPVKQLAREPFITCKAGYEPPIIDLFERAGAPFQSKYIVQSVSMALRMAEEGLGYPILSELALKTLPPRLVKSELEPEAYRDIRLAVPSLHEASHAVKLFIRTTLSLFPPQERRS
ncbi:LysR family transcriptional regulator [Cohnella thailandensis]|uniref:LysR family transcriptional regulator n=1 Tax=Cohnella thailandensis TaxID=557557 RepID=A0A841T6R7_9BACL|nr:LysR family transcriptional regulator [Cohnella thailandensis]MBB6636851.1 LysR family transcriptional regulator [Cohnella thailandensis]MBP1973271.1 DNA-binding transcriptional LysR family regulator [Cohnella thailandensis]